MINLNRRLINLTPNLIRGAGSIKNINNANNDKQPKQEEKQQDEKSEEVQTPFTGGSPSLSNSSSYIVHEDYTQYKENDLIYESTKADAYKLTKLFLKIQTAATAAAPVAYAALSSNVSIGTLVPLCLLPVWGFAFQFIGGKMFSKMVLKLYREPNSDYIKLITGEPNTTVRKIPIEDIQQSLVVSKRGQPFILLENNDMFFFEEKGRLLKPEMLDEILSGTRYENKILKLEEEEYQNSLLNGTSTTVNDSSNSNTSATKEADIDKELEEIQKEIDNLKKNKK
eukprot:gene620-769_t